MDLESLGRFLSLVGVPAGFAFGLLLMIWKVLHAIAPYGHDVYQRHVDLVSTLEVALREQAKSDERQVSQLDQLTEHTESALVLRRAALEAIVVLEKIAERLDLDVEQETMSMRRQLAPNRTPKHP